MTNVRTSAAEVLLRLDKGRTTLAAQLEDARLTMSDRRDRGLLVELAAGTLRWRQQLDVLIEAASRRPIPTIDPTALAVLRLGAYQLLHLDRVPPHAIVNESVEAVRSLGAPRAAGFVNAVLRSLGRRRGSSLLPGRPKPGQPEAEILRYLSITLSHPEWLVRRWLGRYGFEATERWCQFNNRAPDLTVRPLRASGIDALLADMQRQEVQAQRAPFVHDAIRLSPGALGRLSPDLREALVVQDEGAQLVARFVGARRGERILDVCAAPGGKTLVLASDLSVDDETSRSLLVAGDRRPSRVSLLQATVQRAGTHVAVLALDALGPLPFGDVFDAVVVDAPCSGLGTLRRDPDVKWTSREDHLRDFARNQKAMLTSAAGLVRPGGRLVYATCSSEPEENQDVVRTFLSENDRFTLARSDAASVPPSVLNAEGCLETLPFRDGLDAYFAATLVLRRAT